MEAMAYELQDRLMSMGPEQTQAFHDILHIYEELADQYGLWDAASIMMEWCSDDGFIDFPGPGLSPKAGRSIWPH